MSLIRETKFIFMINSLEKIGLELLLVYATKSHDISLIY